MMLRRLILLIVSVLFMVSCTEEGRDPKLDFVGDSIIARWDLAEFFPSSYVENFGRSGATINYIESLAGKFNGATVVLMIGTNDNNMLEPASVDSYVDQYVATITKLGASKIFLYSLLPREFTNDRKDINKDILVFNEKVREKVAGYSYIIYLDVYTKFLLDGKINPQLYNDGLHLSIYGYDILAEALKNQL